MQRGSRTRALPGPAGLVGLTGAIHALLAACWLVASAGCTGPGLEPPWSDDGDSKASGNSAPAVLPPTTAAPNGPGEFGNPIGAAGTGATMAGGAGSPSTQPTTPPPSAGAGAVEPPPVTTPDVPGDGGAAGASDPGQPPASGDPLKAVDFVPDCESEAPTALASVDACRYPLPNDPALDAASAQVATLDAGMPVLLTGGQNMLSCLFGSDYYVDASVAPAVIVLCSQLCSALPSTAQVVAVGGCAKVP